jgi:hypothetical protein
MTHALALMQFRTHTVHISRTAKDEIIVFKYNGTNCEWEIFSDYDSASDYIVTGLSEWTYTLEEQ